MIKKTLILFLSLGGLFCSAKVWNNSYVSFEMLDNWVCKPFGTDWVCHSSLSRQQKEAMIILTAKQAGSLDTLESYVNFLQRPRKNTTKSQSFTSKVFHSKKVFINNHPWVDGFHKESEIPSYYTRYLATVCCKNSPQKLAILITYSAHENFYTTYASQFLKSIKSLRVLDVKQALNKIKKLKALGKSGSIGSYMEGVVGFDSDFQDGEISSQGKVFLLGLSQVEFFGLLVILLGVLGYIVFKFRKKKKKKKSKKKR